MSEVGVLRITKIIEKWDMRGVHKLRKLGKTKKLRRGQCLIAFNKAQTIGRIIDNVGGVHTYYTTGSKVFDIDELSNLVDESFWVSLKIGKTTKKQASHLKRAA
jgi:hypothetical protein